VLEVWGDGPGGAAVIVGTTEAHACVTLRALGGHVSEAELIEGMKLRKRHHQAFVNGTLPRMERKGLLVIGLDGITETPQGVAVAEITNAICTAEVPCNWEPETEGEIGCEVCWSCGAHRGKDGTIRDAGPDEGWELPECPLRAEAARRGR
jgi:hypothetical protein